MLAELRHRPLDLFYWTAVFCGAGKTFSLSSRPLLLDRHLLVVLAELRHCPLDLIYWTAVFWWRWQNYVTVL
jgi:hypothetical protein